MRLIAAYIAGFGRLTDTRIDYEREITALCMENGWGKTTLAYFHKAIFYGLDSTGKLRGEIKERDRYKPWTAAPFGGWLEFAVSTPEGEKAYRIERSFGDKPAKDRFTLRSLPDLRPSADFSDPVGMALFGLNAGSFIRTVFSTGTLRTPPQTPDSGLLAERFGENPADGKTLNRAIEKLEARRVELQTRRGDNGRIPDLRREVFALDQQIADCRLAAKQAQQHRANLLEISEQIGQDQVKSAEIREEIDRCSQKQADAAHLEHYRGLLDQIEGFQKEKSDEEAFFRDAECSDEALNLLQKKAEDCRFAAETAKQATAPFEDAKEYEDLFARFRGGLPDGDALQNYREIAEKLVIGRRREQEIRQSAEYRQLSERFAEHLPEEETVNRMLALAQVAPKPGKRIARLIPIPIGLVMIGIGILCGLLTENPLRSAFLWLFAAVGSALILLSVFLLCRKGGKKKENSALTAFFDEYDLSAENGALLALHKFCLDVSTYRSRMDTLASLAAENQALSAELVQFLDCYQAPDLRTLEAWVNRYLALDRVRIARSERAKSARARAAALSAELGELLSRYPVDVQNPEAAIAEIRRHRNALSVASRALADAKRAAEHLALQHPNMREISEEPADALSLDRLRAQEREISERLDAGKDAYRREEAALLARTGEADRLPLLTEERQRKIEQSEQASAALAAIERAEALLTQASQNLSDRYLKGVQERFAHYLRKLTPDETESARYRMDGSLAVLSEEAGKQRESGLLSAGKQDLVALCARFALTDALMGGKADFLILDDPFTNLDDRRADAALALLRELAEDRQILYLTCSQSRMPTE